MKRWDIMVWTPETMSRCGDGSTPQDIRVELCFYDVAITRRVELKAPMSVSCVQATSKKKCMTWCGRRWSFDYGDKIMDNCPLASWPTGQPAPVLQSLLLLPLGLGKCRR